MKKKYYELIYSRLFGPRMFFQTKNSFVSSVFTFLPKKVSYKPASYIKLNKEKSILHLDFEEKDSKLMSIFNLSIWILRNKVRCDGITNLITHFMGIFKNLCLKYNFT
jgi:hypothetical protein